MEHTRFQASQKFIRFPDKFTVFDQQYIMHWSPVYLPFGSNIQP